MPKSTLRLNLKTAHTLFSVHIRKRRHLLDSSMSTLLIRRWARASLPDFSIGK